LIGETLGEEGGRGEAAKAKPAEADALSARAGEAQFGRLL